MTHEPFVDSSQFHDYHRNKVIETLHAGWNNAVKISEDIYQGSENAFNSLLNPDNHDHGTDHSARVARNFAWGCLSVVDLLRFESPCGNSPIGDIKSDAIFGGQVAALTHDIGALETGSRVKHAETGAIILANMIRPAIERGDIGMVGAYTAVAATLFHSYDNAIAHAAKHHKIPPLNNIASIIDAAHPNGIPETLARSMQLLRENNWIESFSPDYQTLGLITAVSRRIANADELDGLYPFSNVRAMITFPGRPAYSGANIETIRGADSGMTVDDLSRILGETARNYRPIAAVSEMKAYRTLKLEKLFDLKNLVCALSATDNVRKQRVLEYLEPKLEKAREALTLEFEREGGNPSIAARTARMRLEHFGNYASEILSSPIKRIPPEDTPRILAHIDSEIVRLRGKMQLYGAYRPEQIVDPTIVVADWKI